MEHLASFISGRWIESDETYELRSPGTGEVIANVSNGTRQEVDAAVSAAQEAFQTTRRIPLFERAETCERIASAIDDRVDALAADLSEEQGKPPSEAEAEVRTGAWGFRLAAQEIRRLDGYIPPTRDPSKRVLVVRQTLGIWAILTPWNFPFNIPIEYLGTAVATGSPFVWKPAPTTPRIATRLVELMVDSGVPEKAVNLLLTNSIDVSQALVTHPGIDAVGVTGGARTGQAIARAAWDKHLLLELGGNGPLIVLDDADIERALPAIASSAFRNAGQVCSAAGRLMVSGDVAGDLAGMLGNLAGGIVLGSHTSNAADMGPVHTEAVASTVDRHVRDALERGAQLITGGSRASGFPTALFYQPTVLDLVSRDAALNREETFGPIAPIIRMNTDDEIVDAANSGQYGLVAAVFTSSMDRAFRMAERLETGTVVVNDTSNYWELHLPFGGRAGKWSGRGRLGGRHTVEEFTQIKTISIDVS